MRYFEITSGMRLPISAEESKILTAVEENGFAERDTMDERQAEIARQMVSRGLLLRSRVDGKVRFEPNADHNLRRF